MVKRKNGFFKELCKESNIYVADLTYKTSPYEKFEITEPKRRIIYRLPYYLENKRCKISSNIIWNYRFCKWLCR